MRAMSGPPAHEVPIEQARAGHEAETKHLSGPGEPVAEVRDIEISAPSCRIPVRLYRPEGDAPLPLVAYLHGGGWALGSIQSFDTVLRALANASGAIIAGVGYRLAPEHPFPAALEDTLAAYRELLARGADPARTVLAGDSAGGWLVLAAALRLRDDGDRLPAAPGLVSPWLDLLGTSWPVDRTDAMLRPAWLRRCAAGFAADAGPAAPEFALLEADLTGLPPMTVHVGSEEILLDDAVRLGRAARSAGVAVDLRRLDGLWHVAHASAGMVLASTAAVHALGAALAARCSGGQADSARADGAAA